MLQFLLMSYREDLVQTGYIPSSIRLAVSNWETTSIELGRKIMITQTNQSGFINKTATHAKRGKLKEMTHNKECGCNYQNDYYGDQVCRSNHKRVK